MNAWILLRGLARESRHWGDFTGLMSERFADTPVIAIDLPGNGVAHVQRSPADVPAMLLAVREALVVRGLTPPFGVVAMSLGAMVTVEWAQQHPHELSAAVLINTSLRPFSPFYRRLRPTAWPGLVRAALAGDAWVREHEVWQLTSHRPPTDRQPIVARWAGFQDDRPVTRGNALRQLVAAARYEAPRTPPQVPLLLLSSACDGLVSPRCSAAIAQAWSLALKVHPWAGHDLPLDDAGWVIERVATFEAAVTDDALR